MPEILGAGLRGPLAEREITHPPQLRLSRPAQIGPGGNRFGCGAGKSAWRSASMHVSIRVARHPGQRLAAGTADQDAGTGRLRRWPDLPLFPDVADGFQLFAKAATTSAAVDAGGDVILAAGTYGQAKGEPPTRERVQRGGLLGEDGRIGKRRARDHGGEPDPSG